MLHEEPPKRWRTMNPVSVTEAGLPALVRKRWEYTLEDPEIILQAAIVHPTGEVYTVSRPGRHPDIISYMAALRRAGLRNTKRQGYITSHGRFVNRKDGLRIAEAAKQIIHKHPAYWELYTEDMW